MFITGGEMKIKRVADAIKILKGTAMCDWIPIDRVTIVGDIELSEGDMYEVKIALKFRSYSSALRRDMEVDEIYNIIHSGVLIKRIYILEAEEIPDFNRSTNFSNPSGYTGWRYNESTIDTSCTTVSYTSDGIYNSGS